MMTKHSKLLHNGFVQAAVLLASGSFSSIVGPLSCPAPRVLAYYSCQPITDPSRTSILDEPADYARAVVLTYCCGGGSGSGSLRKVRNCSPHLRRLARLIRNQGWGAGWRVARGAGSACPRINSPSWLLERLGGLWRRAQANCHSMTSRTMAYPWMCQRRSRPLRRLSVAQCPRSTHSTGRTTWCSVRPR